MKSLNFYASSVELDAHMTRFGLRVAAGLNERNAALPHDLAERLRFAREQALTRAAQVRAAGAVASPASAGVVRSGKSLALTGGPGSAGNGWWAKLAATLPLIMLLAGLWVMQRGQFHEEIAASAEVDTALLSDKLPPSAFGDPGFAEFLADGEE